MFGKLHVILSLSQDTHMGMRGLATYKKEAMEDGKRRQSTPMECTC